MLHDNYCGYFCHADIIHMREKSAIHMFTVEVLFTWEEKPIEV